MNEKNRQYPLYCGVEDFDYIDFLKTLREHIETHARVSEREIRKFQRLQRKFKIDQKALKLLRGARLNFQYSNSIAGDESVCVPIAAKTPTPEQTKYCPKCTIEVDGCDGNPKGADVGDPAKTGKNDWCHKKCRAGKGSLKFPGAKEASDKVDRAFEELTLKVIEEKVQEVRGPLYAS